MKLFTGLTWLEKQRKETEMPPEETENLEIPAGTGKTFVHSDYKESTRSLRFDLTDEDDRTLFVQMVGECNLSAVNFQIRQEKNLVWIEL